MTSGARSSLKWLLLATGLGICAAGLWTYLRQERRSDASGALTAVPFTTYTGLENAPSFSPDGSQLAFAWAADEIDQYDLFVKVIGSEKPLRLTNHPADILSPAWSPDGREIAFVRLAPDSSGLYVVPALGGPERKLADVRLTYFLEGILSWSPDGRRLAFYDQEPNGHSGVFLLDIDTLERRWLGDPSPDCIQTWVPAFSPDGSSIAVGCMVSIGENDLYLLPAAGGIGRRIAHVSGEFAGIAWTGDSKNLIASSNGDLFRISVADGQSQKLLSGAYTVAISHDGHRLAYEQGNNNANIWQVLLAAPTRPAGPPVKVVSSSLEQRNGAVLP